MWERVNDMITVRIAELNIGVSYRYSLTGDFLSEYRVDGDADFTVEETDEDLLYEAEFAEQGTASEYLECAAVYRKIADKITEYDGAVFHGAVLAIDGGAYVIAARSGVGKTTHIRLWLERFGDRVYVLNGDKPIIRAIDGILYVCGTPYNGKEGYGKKENLPLKAIAFLERGENNSYERITSSDALMRFMAQIYINDKNPVAVSKTLRLASRILSEAELFEFRCNKDISAAEMAEKAFFGGASE